MQVNDHVQCGTSSAAIVINTFISAAVSRLVHTALTQLYNQLICSRSV